jgi:hypothetical protein
MTVVGQATHPCTALQAALAGKYICSVITNLCGRSRYLEETKVSFYLASLMQISSHR